MNQKLLALFCAAMVAASLLTACGGSSSSSAPTEESNSPAASSASSVPEESEAASSPASSQAAETDASLPDLTGHTLMIYCGAGMTEPFEKIAEAFRTATGCEMNVTYANAGQIQSQINTAQEGDLFIAGSADELGPVESFVTAQKDLVKHIPVLAVQAGNPKGLTGLASLTQEGVTLLMGDVESTPIGKIAQKALTDQGILDQVTLAATTTTAPQMSTALTAGEADAAIVWKENCNVEGVEILDTADLDPYIKTIPAASLSCSADSEALEAFNAYLDTDAANAIWMEYGYELVE